ncbi:MAG: Ribose 5-phosphate isomerase B, partial [Escherichia coli DORA_A_5_14_21]
CFLLKNVPEQWAVMSLAPQDSALLCQPFIHGQ